MAEETPSSVAVALLYDAGEGGASTREALVASGASIVYEAESAGFDADALAGSGAGVVVVDLHGSEDDFEGLDDLLDRYRVIINDAEVSSALSGWDRARWQRHLGAKILGGGVDPPRPDGAEPVPERPRPVVQPPTVEVPPADTGEAVPLPAVPEAGPGVAAADFDAAELDPLDALLSIDIPEPLAPSIDMEPELPAAVEMLAGDGLPRAEPVVEEGDLAIDIPPVDAPDGDDWGLLDFDSLPEAPLLAPGPVDDSTDAADADAEPVSAEWEELAATADSILLAEAEKMEEAPAPVEVPAAEGPQPSEAPSTPSIQAPEWTLEDIADTPPSPATDPGEFGIEKIEAAEFLAPTDDAPAGPASHEAFGLELELIPLEEAVAPTQVSDEPLHESRLEHAAAAPKIRQVWVLGASVGGPEAVREFLAALPRETPALFLLAQHLGGEFVDIMVRQLAQATPLTVRTPEHGDRVGHGEVIIVPADRRLRVDPSGTVVLREAAADSAFSPSIDHLLEDVAEAFGATAGAIIFSGMGEDAVDGCRSLAAAGGKVWLQDPQTCVVATMVEGVQQTGVASFVGSPAELADHVQAVAA